MEHTCKKLKTEMPLATLSLHHEVKGKEALKPAVCPRRHLPYSVANGKQLGSR